MDDKTPEPMISHQRSRGLNKSDTQRHRIEVRLTETEWRTLAAHAQRMGLTMAGLLRMAALGEVERRRWLLEGSKIEGAAREVL